MATDDNSISAWQQRVGSLMTQKGFHADFRDRHTVKAVLVEQRLLRLIGEVAEAADVVKKEWSSVSTHCRVGDARFGEELADVLYRLLDLAFLTEVDLEAAIAAKHEKNRLRPYRYGTAEAVVTTPLQPPISHGREDRGPLGVQYTLPLDFYEVAAGPSDSEGGEQ